jgi:membrane protein involved in colicin uptake
MTYTPPRGTLLDLPLIQERYGWAFVVSIAFHCLLVAFFLLAPLFMPELSPIQIGTGPGGGTGGESYSVGVTDDLGGGAGLFKPALTPQPPALPVEKPAQKEEVISKAIPLPNTVVPKSSKKSAETAATKAAKTIPAPASNVIPVAGAKGAGGSGGAAGGAGGGSGGGTGISIGSGSGGLIDSWYARAVETRVGSNWIKPVGLQQRVEIVYSFLVADDGRIYEIKKEKSSGNDALDLTAERAIRASNPLTQPPPELRGKPLQFMCQFVYPPDK